MAFPKREVAIVGVYQTEQAPRIARSSTSLQLEAIKGALDDAGLSMEDVDAIHPGQHIGFPKPSPVSAAMSDIYMYWAEQLGQRPLLSVAGHMGGVIPKMALALNAGMCEVGVIFHGSAGGPGYEQSTRGLTKAPRVGEWDFNIWGPGPRRTPIGAEASEASRAGGWDLGMFGLYVAPWYAMWAQRYMHEFGVSSEKLAAGAVTDRYHATLNPASLMGKYGPITTADVLNSPIIVHPLHLLDGSLDNDGGYAIVMTTAERARDLKKKPVYILGGAEANHVDSYLNIHDPWFPKEGRAMTKAANRAFAMAGVSRDDIDVAGIYDCFTITMVRGLEDVGFCEVGEGADFVYEGNTRLGGKLPTNTHGGLLSCSHPGYPNGLHVIEVVKQLRGNEVEPERQVKGAKIGLTSGQGISLQGTTSVVIMAAD